jgi:hypothetical protein
LDFNVPQPIQTNVSDETSHDKTDAAGSASKPVQGHAAHQDESTAAAMPFEAESVPETGGSAEANNLTPVPHKPQVSKSNAGEDSPSSELAFASRIQEQSKTNPTQTSKDSTSGQSSAEQPEPAAASASPRTGAKTPSASEEERQPVPVKPDAAVNTQTVSQAYSSRTDFQPAPPQAQPTPAASRVETPVPPAEAKSAAPLKDVTFQVTQESAKVEVRIVQEAGDVRVAVRSGDTDLVHGLRQDLSDLSGKLQQSGYSAETWRPGAVTESTGSNNDTRKDTGDSGNGQPQSQSGGSHQDRGQQQQHRFNRPQWLDEMESTSNTQVHTIGVSNGFDS